MSISLTVLKPRFPTVLLNVCEFPPQRRSLASLLTGFGVPVAVRGATCHENMKTSKMSLYFPSEDKD